MPTPNFELLKDAYEIIDGIPDKNINLNDWRLKDCGLTCGTIACAAGWLTMHPKFIELGLRYEKRGENNSDIAFKDSIHMEALGELFSISEDDALGLFGVVWDSRVNNHKELFLARVRTFLGAHGQLKEQLAA